MENVSRQISVGDIVKFDTPDSNYQYRFPRNVYNIAQQIIQQREFMKVAQRVNLQLEQGEKMEDILMRLSNISF